MLPEFLKFICIAVGAILAVYVVVRVASAAYFKSRQQFMKD